MLDLVKPLSGPLAKEYFTAFQRYEEQKPDDFGAILTKDLDKLDMVIQALEYEEAKAIRDKSKAKFLNEFFESTKDIIKTKDAKLMRNHLQTLHGLLPTPYYAVFQRLYFFLEPIFAPYH